MSTNSHAPLPPRTSSSSDTSAGTGLRARKLSLTTRQLPLSIATTGSQISPSQSSAASTSPGPRDDSLSASEIGLGLMLEDHQNSLSSRSESVADQDQAETDRFFLAAGADAASSSSTITASRQTRLPQLSTVTTSTGATPSPLQIFTGSPQPSPSFSSNSPLPSPAHAAPPSISSSSARPYSPHHASYNMSTAASATSSAGSVPMSRPPSYNTIMGSSSMERTRSSGSDIHSRQQSLTSACPPATSSISNHGAPYQTPKNDITAFSPATSAGPRGWRTYDWGVPNSHEKGHDEDVRQGAKSSRGPADEVGVGSKILAIPNMILAIFLAPIFSTSSSASSSSGSSSAGPSSLTRMPHSPNPNLTSAASKASLLQMGSSSSTGSTNSTKRYPAVVRYITLFYLLFAVTFFTIELSIGMLSPSNQDSIRARLESKRGQEGWQLMRQYADGLGQKAGIDLGWTHHQAGQASVVDQPDPEDWGMIRRIGHPDHPVTDLAALDPSQNPLTPFSHTYRFSKMHEKVHWDLHDEIVPFAFHAAAKPTSDEVTACLYSNPAWLDSLPAFLRTWRGPVSLVFETAHSRFDTDSRAILLSRIERLRDSDTLVKTFVDFHLIGTPPSMSERTLNKTRERMIKNPAAHNYHLNLARFFAKTQVVFLAGDARLIPSGGLRRKLTTPAIRKLVLDKGDAVVVPAFAFIRDPTADPETNPIPSIHQIQTKLSTGTEEELAVIDPFSGVGQTEFDVVAQEYVRTLYETLPLQPPEWPARKQQLVQLVNTRIPSPDTPTSATLCLFDKRWDMNHGPTNWYLWRKSSLDPKLQDEPTAGGGLGLGVDGRVGGGKEVYKVIDYDLHYSPHVVVSKAGQPWCTERFDDVRAACVYQMYLTGAELWVLPDEWVYTLEPVEKRPESDKQDPADKLRTSISSRLYGKFHQEACMHYGREFLSVAMWDSEKAQHLRETCARTLSSWGMGSG